MKLHPWDQPYALVKFGSYGTRLAYIPECRRDPKTLAITSWRGRSMAGRNSCIKRDWSNLNTTMRTFTGDDIIAMWREAPSREQIGRAQRTYRQRRSHDLAATLIPTVPYGYL